MTLSRRAVLGWALVPAPPAGAASFTLEPAPQEQVLLCQAGAGGSVVLPAAGCRLVAAGNIGAVPGALVAFADPRPGRRAALLAVAGRQGGALRLLALELLAWQGADGAHLQTRPRLSPGAGCLLLAREAAAPRAGRLAWRREAWIDRLAPDPAGGLADAPVRPPPSDTWQARLARQRATVRAMLGGGGGTVTARLIAAASESPMD